MKIGVISDTHLYEANTRLQDILSAYFHEVDMVIHAGDFVTMEVLRYLQEHYNRVEAVHGNMDPYDLQEYLPNKKVITVGTFQIGIIHGWGAPWGIDDRICNKFENVHCIVFGHTHNSANQQRDGVLFFNPGSPTDKRFARENSVGILEIDEEIRGHILTIEK